MDQGTFEQLENEVFAAFCTYLPRAQMYARKAGSSRINSDDLQTILQMSSTQVASSFVMEPVDPDHHVTMDEDWVPLHATGDERAAIVALSAQLYQRWEQRWISGKATLTHKVTRRNMLH